MTATPSTAPRLQPPPPPGKKKLSGCAIAGIGCGVVALIVLIAGGVGVWWVANNAKNLMMSGGGYVLKAGIEQSDLPADQKQRITARIDQVVADYNDGKITDEQLGRVFEAVGETPLIHLGAVMAIEAKYITPSAELTAEEKQAGRRSLERFARAIYEEKLPQEAIDKITAPVSTTDAEGEPQLKDKPTTDEVREMLRLAAGQADAAGVPDEPFTINVADEFDRAVDQALSTPVEQQP